MYIFISDKSNVGGEIVTTLVQTFKVKDEKMNKYLIDRIGKTIHDLYTFTEEERMLINEFTKINQVRLSTGRVDYYIGSLSFDLFSVDYTDTLPGLVGDYE